MLHEGSLTAKKRRGFSSSSRKPRPIKSWKGETFKLAGTDCLLLLLRFSQLQSYIAIYTFHLLPQRPTRNPRPNPPAAAAQATAMSLLLSVLVSTVQNNVVVGFLRSDFFSTEMGTRQSDAADARRPLAAAAIIRLDHNRLKMAAVPLMDRTLC